jgi:hypothetical protein
VLSAVSRLDDQFGTHRVSQVAGATAVLSRERERSFELKGDQIKVFYNALAAAMKVCAADIAIHTEHWADEETGVTPSPSTPETEFSAWVNQIVADEAPSVFAVVAELGKRADGMLLAWGMKLPNRNRIELVSADYERTRVTFSSLENVWRIFSIHGKIKIRIVPVDGAQKQAAVDQSHD